MIKHQSVKRVANSAFASDAVPRAEPHLGLPYLMASIKNVLISLLTLLARHAPRGASFSRPCPL